MATTATQPGSDPLHRVAALLRVDGVIRAETVEAAPAAKGAYALLMRFDAPASFLHKRALHSLDAGWYAYAGSAYGPGGLRARLRRHFRRDKALHWHVDGLTGEAVSLHAIALEAGSECAIADELVRSGGFSPSLPGFGSSDCTRCATHLLEWRG